MPSLHALLALLALSSSSLILETGASLTPQTQAHRIAQKRQSNTNENTYLANNPSRQSWCNAKKSLLDIALRDRVKDNLAATGTDSWVSGTRMEALLELDTPTLSIYNPNYYPITSQGQAGNAQVNSITAEWLAKSGPNDRTMVVENGGAAGDTASVGVGFLNAARTKQPTSERKKYALYADREIHYLLRSVPRLSKGAISHRPPNEPPQAWNDFVYMVPPFLAYWGVLNHNATIAKEAYTQIKLYRDIFRDPKAGNLWRHISHTSWGVQDDNLWGTGIAWALAGITRVYATLVYSPFRVRFANELKDLAAWSNELIQGSFAKQNAKNGLLPNWYNTPLSSTFDEAASSALIASAAYRLAALGMLKDEKNMIAKAEKARTGVYAVINKSTSWMPAVNPVDWDAQTDKSPESMAFILLMEAAARDFYKGCNC